MTVTLDDAILQLNMEEAVDDWAEVELFVDAANEWVAATVTDTTPAPVRLATLMLIAHLWETQRGPASSPLAGDDVITVRGAGYAIPNRVLELLAPYPHVVKSGAVPLASFPEASSWPDPVERCW